MEEKICYNERNRAYVLQSVNEGKDFMMLNTKMQQLGSNRSVIRELFEYGKKRAAEIGEENVFDFSLGNPSVPAPKKVQETIASLNETMDPVALHGYTSAQGDAAVRRTMADSANTRYGANLDPELIYMTCGAAASLVISLRALCVEGDEFVAFTPFFPEYRVFVEGVGGKLVVCESEDGTFQIDIARLETCVTPNTKAIILNSPNNPSGVVIIEENIRRMCALLEKKQKEYGHPIYLITDEPYRELVYGGVKVPYLTNYYDNTIVGYSFSKSLSLPGERIGYIAVSPRAEDAKAVYAAVAGAGRALGYVCAPSMFQRVAAACVDLTADVSIYCENRDLLYNGLTDLGYTCVKPDGAFYLFVKALEPDANAFSERAKRHELLLVPSDDFGTPGYVRISYCVKTETIKRAMPAFAALAEEYRNKAAF